MRGDQIWVIGADYTENDYGWGQKILRTKLNAIWLMNVG
ncbi:MAG: hypothetical protein M2R45_03965 [Verrucomicrobia subdivision 3 bacterium]|nr:hypothetical protein [Limisphaerales bacterium]MCS1415515.1 hypothetical protein [Limisphaerales bacterium]